MQRSGARLRVLQRFLLMIGALSVGCAPQVTAPALEGGETPRRFRGHLVHGHEVRSFTPCGSPRELWVIDRTGPDLWETYRALTVEPYQKLYAEVRAREVPAPGEGFGADYDGALVVLELRRAARETAGCAEDQAGLAFVARGNEPFWRLEIRADEIRFRELGAPRDRLFPHAVPRVSDRIRSYVLRSAEAPGTVMEILLTERRCVDSMSGERLPYTAELRIDGRVLSGCASEGEG